MSTSERVRVVPFVLALALMGIWASASWAAEDSVPALAQALAELPPDSTVLEIPEGLYTIGSTWVISDLVSRFMARASAKQSLYATRALTAF